MALSTDSVQNRIYTSTVNILWLYRTKPKWKSRRGILIADKFISKDIAQHLVINNTNGNFTCYFSLAICRNFWERELYDATRIFLKLLNRFPVVENKHGWRFNYFPLQTGQSTIWKLIERLSSFRRWHTSSKLALLSRHCPAWKWHDRYDSPIQLSSDNVSRRIL